MMRVTDGMIAGILNFGERPGKIFEKDQNFWGEKQEISENTSKQNDIGDVYWGKSSTADHSEAFISAEMCLLWRASWQAGGWVLSAVRCKAAENSGTCLYEVWKAGRFQWEGILRRLQEICAYLWQRNCSVYLYRQSAAIRVPDEKTEQKRLSVFLCEGNDGRIAGSSFCMETGDTDTGSDAPKEKTLQRL